LPRHRCGDLQRPDAKVKFIPLSANDRFKALLAGEVDVLVAQFDLDDHATTRRPACSSPASITMTARD
jgi:ABC-type amino acid transport substrate-binding protein